MKDKVLEKIIDFPANGIEQLISSRDSANAFASTIYIKV